MAGQLGVLYESGLNLVECRGTKGYPRAPVTQIMRLRRVYIYIHTYSHLLLKQLDPGAI